MPCADLVVEIVGPDRPARDIIVNPLAATITVLAREGERYSEHGIFGRAERAASKLPDGFSVSVDEVLDAR